jgi:hypothetical protein
MPDMSRSRFLQDGISSRCLRLSRSPYPRSGSCAPTSLTTRARMDPGPRGDFLPGAHVPSLTDHGQTAARCRCRSLHRREALSGVFAVSCQGWLATQWRIR